VRCAKCELIRSILTENYFQLSWDVVQSLIGYEVQFIDYRCTFFEQDPCTHNDAYTSGHGFCT
jgi:hypothetical protein